MEISKMISVNGGQHPVNYKGCFVYQTLQKLIPTVAKKPKTSFISVVQKKVEEAYYQYPLHQPYP